MQNPQHRPRVSGMGLHVDSVVAVAVMRNAGVALAQRTRMYAITLAPTLILPKLRPRASTYGTGCLGGWGVGWLGGWVVDSAASSTASARFFRGVFGRVRLCAAGRTCSWARAESLPWGRLSAPACTRPTHRSIRAAPPASSRERKCVPRTFQACVLL